MPAPYSGRCACGAATVSIAGEPLSARMCWCRDCQRIACGSATVNVVFPSECTQFAGEIATVERIADSGNVAERGFCRKCGSQLFARMVRPAGDILVIRAGVLDDLDVMTPQSIIWTDSAPSWAVFDPRLPQYPKGPK